MSLALIAISDPLLPIRILAGLGLVAVVSAFVYVFSHLRRIEKTIAKDNLVPAERGPRNNLVLIICAIPIIVTAVLLFLVLKA
jgi:hypothetical protein